MARIYETDDYLTMARIIYEEFEVGQSCTVSGMVKSEIDVWPKGEKVCEELRRLDALDHLQPRGAKMSRRRKILPNSIGGWVAQKIFRYEMRKVDGSIRYQIWRVQ